MSTVETYLVRRISVGLLIAAAVLLPLFSFFDLIEEMEDVGQGFYRM